jgi:oligopeptide/dipeptide ABC transporter ATP-binding protein
MEVANSDDLFRRPLHPYTQALLKAVPVPDPRVERGRERVALKGDMPSALNPPAGCRFSTRCPFARERCRDEEPRLEAAAPGHTVACHFWAEIEATGGRRIAEEVR